MAYARLSPGDRRAQLLELGVRMFTERPYDDLSMEDLAAAGRVSKGLLYHYFPSKRSLYLEVLRTAAADLLAVTEPDPSLPRDEQLRAALFAYLGYVRERADAYRAVLRGGVGADAEVAAVAEEVRRAIRDRIMASQGIRRPSATLRIAVTGWVGLVEAASLDWLEHSDLSAGELVEMLTGALAALLAAIPR